jgi:hypothetical protein
LDSGMLHACAALKQRTAGKRVESCSVGDTAAMAIWDWATGETDSCQWQ